VIFSTTLGYLLYRKGRIEEIEKDELSLALKRDERSSIRATLQPIVGFKEDFLKERQLGVEIDFLEKKLVRKKRLATFFRNLMRRYRREE
jgi:hypothetical protein